MDSETSQAVRDSALDELALAARLFDVVSALSGPSLRVARIHATLRLSTAVRGANRVLGLNRRGRMSAARRKLNRVVTRKGAIERRLVDACARAAVADDVFEVAAVLGGEPTAAQVWLVSAVREMLRPEELRRRGVYDPPDVV